MVLAYDYPLMGVFFSILYVVLWIVFILMLVHVLGGIFRDRDMRGITKAAWLILILFLPFIGVMIYMIVRDDVMAPSAASQIRSADEAASRGYLHLRG